MFFIADPVAGRELRALFVGWEAWGSRAICSSGFYFLKKSASDAGKKAFIAIVSAILDSHAGYVFAVPALPYVGFPKTISH